MTQVKMPEPVAYFYQRDFDKYKDRYPGGIPVITTDQAETYAEVYAAAKVREALEQAIAICDAAYEQGKAEYRASCNPYFEGGCDAAETIESKIRALISKEPT